MCVLAKLYIGNESLFELHPIEHGTKKERLFHLYITQPNKNKAFYRNELFGVRYNGTGYEVLRGELFSSLFNHMFKTESMASATQISDRVELAKQVFGLRLVRANGRLESRLVFKSIKTLLRKCEKFGLRLEQLHLIKICIHVTGLIGDRKAFTKYKGKLAALKATLAVEDSLHITQSEWFLNVRNDKHISSDKISSFEKELDRISALISSGVYDSDAAEYKVLGLRIHLADAKKDFRSIVKYAEVGLSYSKKIPVASVEINMSIYLAYANANLGNEQEFEHWEKRSYDLLKGEDLNYAILAEVSFAYKMSKGQFGLAYKDLLSFSNDNRFTFLSEDKKDTWNLFLLYLKFAVNSTIWKHPILINWPNTKKVSQLIQGPLKTNKVGTNISLIILTFCEDLRGEKFEKLLQMEDSLIRYVSRNLKTLNERPRVFLKMLLKVIQLDFISFEIEKKTKKQLEKLETMDPNFNMDLGGNEIIRYEVLWDWILKKLRESSLLPKPKA